MRVNLVLFFTVNPFKQISKKKMRMHTSTLATRKVLIRNISLREKRLKFKNIDEGVGEQTHVPVACTRGGLSD